MAEQSKIEWTDATWNPITGCTMVSAGCTNCYAMGLAATRLRHHPSRAGLTRITGGRPVWTGEVRLNEQWLDQPLRWRKPRMIFVCAHGDLFHENVPDQWIDRVFAVMALAPQHTFQVLTKRPDRALGYLKKLLVEVDEWDRIEMAAMDLGATPDQAVAAGNMFDKPLPNVWLGTSVEDQITADARIPPLLATPAAVRFVSAEPLLRAVDLRTLTVKVAPGLDTDIDALTGETASQSSIFGGSVLTHDASPEADWETYGPRLDWVIVGGESGPNARPMHPDWARYLRDQCQAAGVAFFFKQWGEHLPISDDDHPLYHTDRRGDARSITATLHDGGQQTWVTVGKTRAGRLLDGREWNEMPPSPQKGGAPCQP